MARYLKPGRVDARPARPGQTDHPAPAVTDRVADVSPYLCRPTRHFDLMVGPYSGLAKAHLRCRQIRSFDPAPGVLRIIKVPSGFWVVRQVERHRDKGQGQD